MDIPVPSAPASTPTLYALPSEHYAFNNLKGLINGIAKAHWAIRKEEGRSRVYQVVHITAALIEAVPVAGHVVALFEVVIVRGVRWLFLKPQVLPPLPLPPQPDVFEPDEGDADISGSDSDDEDAMPVAPDAPPFGPCIPRPLSFARISAPVEMNYPLVPFFEPRARASRMSPLISFTLINMMAAGAVLPENVLRAIFGNQPARSQEPVLIQEGSQQIFPVVLFRGLNQLEQAECGDQYPIVPVSVKGPLDLEHLVIDALPFDGVARRYVCMMPIDRSHAVSVLGSVFDFPELAQEAGAVAHQPSVVLLPDEPGADEIALERVPEIPMLEVAQSSFFQRLAEAACKGASEIYQVGSLAHQAGAIGFQVGTDLVSKNPKSIQVLDDWFVKMGPAFNELCPAAFNQSLKAFNVLKHPNRTLGASVLAAFGSRLREGEGRELVEAVSWGIAPSSEDALYNIMRAYGPIVVAADPSDEIGCAVESIAHVGNMALSSAGYMRRAARTGQYLYENSIGAVARFVSCSAVSKKQARALAAQFSEALGRTMQEALTNITESERLGSKTALFLKTNPTGNLLAYLGDSLVQKIVEKAIVEINRKVNVSFTQSRVVNALGSVVVSVVSTEFQQKSFEVPEGLLEAIQTITEHLPVITSAKRVVWDRHIVDMHILEVCSDLFTIQNALMKTGEVDFNVILASKKHGDVCYGDANVQKACENICVLLSGGNPALALTIEESLRKVLAVGQLVKQGVSDEQSLVLAMTQAMAEDGWISDASNNAASRTVRQVTDSVRQWWGAPSGPEVVRFKQLVDRSAREAALARLEAPNHHVAGATVELLQKATGIAEGNRNAATAVQVARIPFTYALGGNVIEAMLTAGQQIVCDEASGHLAGYARDAAVHYGVPALRLDDRVATHMMQFCVFSDLVARGMSSCYNEEAQRAISSSSSSSISSSSSSSSSYSSSSSSSSFDHLSQHKV